ncbi:hypothetical protein GCM10027089_23760 [Nocardia thraciensis]
MGVRTAVPDEYDAVRRDLSNYERGLYFELGRAHLRGETPERGWVKQFQIPTARGPRILDNANTQGKGARGIERKSGRVDDRTLEQLKRERVGLQTGKITHSRWETVAGEKISPQVREYMEQLGRDFPGRFEHAEISRKDAARAIEVGRSLASRQLELVKAYALDRADRARKRLANIREIVRRREAEAKAKAERERQAREKAERERREREAKEVRDRAERTRVQEKAAREFPTLGELMSRGQGDENTARGRGAPDAAEKARQREAADAATAKATKARDAADAAARKQQRDAADRLGQTAREAREAAARGQRGDMAREVADLLRVTQPTPGVERLSREAIEAARTRAGREERGREREREPRERN